MHYKLRITSKHAILKFYLQVKAMHMQEKLHKFKIIIIKLVEERKLLIVIIIDSLDSR